MPTGGEFDRAQRGRQRELVVQGHAGTRPDNRGQDTIVKEGGTSYTFVTGGLAEAVGQARAAAAADGKDVLLAGGVSIAHQALAAGLVDEMVLHVVPRLAGRGLRLFDAARADLRCTEVIQGEGALHLSYEVR
jgi:dihydrofolate reductase